MLTDPVAFLKLETILWTQSRARACLQEFLGFEGGPIRSARSRLGGPAAAGRGGRLPPVESAGIYPSPCSKLGPGTEPRVPFRSNVRRRYRGQARRDIPPG